MLLALPQLSPTLILQTQPIWEEGPECSTQEPPHTHPDAPPSRAIMW